MKHQKTLEKLEEKKPPTLFKMYRHEMEATMRVNIEGDIARLRGLKDSLGVAISDLKLQLEGLTDELAYLRSSHEEVGITVTIKTHCVTATFAILKRTLFAFLFAGWFSWSRTQWLHLLV